VSGNIDRKFAKLKELGFVGDTASMETEFYLAKGATSNSRTDAEYEYLGGLGFDGALNDRWYAYLTSLGYTGSVDDMLPLFWLNDANIAPPGPTDAEFANVQLLLSMNGENGSSVFTDSSSASRLVTAVNATITTDFSKFGGSSGNFNATNRRVTVNDAPELRMGSSNFTFEAWVYLPSSGNGSFRILADKSEASGSQTQEFSPLINPTNTVNFRYAIATNEWVNPTTTLAIPANTWTHLAFTRSGSTFRGFIGGVLAVTSTSSSPLTGGGTAWRFGSDVTASNGLLGFIDDLRLTKGVARYTETFTPPTEPSPTQ
jgi:hypothetical protein